jgi:hypothetical protein
MATMLTALHVALLRSAVSLALVAGPLISQAVWSMGSPWTDLAVVIAAAAPGDIVLLNGLTFPSFALNKGLVIVGPGTIQPNTSLFPVSVTTLTIPVGQHAHFSDVSFLPILPFFLHRVDANGSVTFVGCTFREGTPHNLISYGTVLLHHCSVSGSAPYGLQVQGGGVLVQSGLCSIVNSTVQGGSGIFGGSAVFHIPATAAVRANGGRLWLSNSTLVGGGGFWSAIYGGVPGAPAVVVAGSSEITDCTLTGGASVSLAGASALDGNSMTRHARSTLLVSAGVPPSTGAVVMVPQLVGIGIDQDFRIGQASTITATAGSSQLLGILAGFDGFTTTHPVVTGPVIGTLSQMVTLTTATPSAGSPVAYALAIPNAPQLVGLALYAQAFQLDGLVVRSSAAIGGAIH